MCKKNICVGIIYFYYFLFQFETLIWQESNICGKERVKKHNDKCFYPDLLFSQCLCPEFQS